MQPPDGPVTLSRGFPDEQRRPPSLRAEAAACESDRRRSVAMAAMTRLLSSSDPSNLLPKKSVKRNDEFCEIQIVRLKFLR
jgi:hypothetical protein